MCKNRRKPLLNAVLVVFPVLALAGCAGFEGPSWKVEGARQGGGSRTNQKVDTPASGFTFEIGASSVVCEDGSGAAQVVGSAANAVGGTAEETTFSACKVLGSATSCGVYGYDGEEKLLPNKGEAFIALEGELVWLGKTGQRTSAGERFAGVLTFKGTKEVITTLKFKEEGLEGCPPELDGKTISITGAQVATLNKETAKETYAELKVNEEFSTTIPSLSLTSRTVEKWNLAKNQYEIVTIGPPTAGAENAGLDGFIHQETTTGKKVGFING